jgi:phosphoribosylglycinamide formyltransferase-1
VDGELLSEYPSYIETSEMSQVKRASRSPVGLVAVLASGRGSDFQAIVDASERGDVDFTVSLLVCNVPGAPVLDRAKRHGIPSVVIDHRNRPREDFERELHDLLISRGIGLVVLAGFMRVLSPWFVSRWRDRVINIHPTLLPSFPGAHAHREVLDHGVKVTGLTIHFVDEDVDHGPIIFQWPVRVMDDDTEETLSRRVLEREHQFYPRIIQLIIDGRVKRMGRRVRIEGEGVLFDEAEFG